MTLWMQMTCVAGGAVVGALARFGVVAASAALWPRQWLPAGTFIVNIVGCLIIGGVAAHLTTRDGPAWLRYFVIVGVLGSFTTFSAFGLELFNLLQQKQWLAAAGYAVLSTLLGVAAVAAGWAVGR